MTSHALKLILLFVEFCDFPGLPFTNSDCQIIFIVFFFKGMNSGFSSYFFTTSETKN